MLVCYTWASELKIYITDKSKVKQRTVDTDSQCFCLSAVLFVYVSFVYVKVDTCYIFLVSVPVTLKFMTTYLPLVIQCQSYTFES